MPGRDEVPARVVEVDYVVIGAGASGMSFTDVVVSESAYTIAIVDEHPQPGGHWNEAYSFVRLHQPSALYGVSSRALGRMERDTHGTNAGYFELATGQQVLSYFDEVMREQFLPSGRVTFLPMSEYLPDGTAISALTGAKTRLVARRRVVDARYLGSEVPSTHTPSFEVAGAAECIPINGLAKLSHPHPAYVILGAGKTGVDAALWLLDQGVDPQKITWVRPHDLWFFNRRCFQPDRSILAFAGDLVEAASKAEGADDLLARLEDAGVFVRIDRSVRPTKFRGATASPAEIDEVGRIERVVRLGRVLRLDPETMHLEEGEQPVVAGSLFIDCTARGLRYRAPVPIYQPDRITLQLAQFTGHPTYSAAIIAMLDLALEDDDVKNDVCPPIPYNGEAHDFAANLLTGLENIPKLDAITPFAEWSRASRLNGLSWALRPAVLEDPVAQADLARLLTMSTPAVENLRRVLDGASVD